MSLFGIPVSQVSPADLDQLVDRHIIEGDRLEYKRDMYGRDDESRRELLRDVTSMANHHGGHLLIGIDENDEGAAKALDGVVSDDRGPFDNWIRDLCLASIEERILGLNVVEIPLASGNVVIIIEIPESPRGCHMVTFRGLNQFWMRHGRRKDRMTVEEIRDGFLRVADARGRVNRFFLQRRAELLDWADGQVIMALAAIPVYFRDEAQIDVMDPKLVTLMVKPPMLPGLPCGYGTVTCGDAVPTLEGRRAESDRPKARLEVHRNGYIEFARSLRSSSSDQLTYAGTAGSSYVNSFAGFLHAFHGSYFPGTSVAVRWAIYNAKGLQLACKDYGWKSNPPWAKEHLELGEFILEDVESGARLLPKSLCDRLWNAFHYEAADIFDANGNWVAR